jgi:thermostable 8-oxoguanine DNA glycosylase
MTKPHRSEGRDNSTALSRSAFPALRAFLRGYLHQDFEQVHGSLGEAVEAFRSDASPAEREQLRKELESLATLAADQPASRLRQFVEELGGGWRPGSDAEIQELLEAMRAR